MVGIGIVGIGFMGMIHYLASRKVEGARVAAICSRDPKKLAGDWTGIQGNFGPKGGPTDLTGVTPYAEFDALLADDSVQLVDLCVPNQQHASLAIKALEAGKHVLVEKPIALSTADADRMVAAAAKAGRLLMVAHVLPYFPEFAFVREAVASGRFGTLQAAHFKRVISRPDWSSGVADFAANGGPAIDLHIHDTHFIGLVCGLPKAVRSRGVAEAGAMLHLDTQYLYDDPNLAVSALSGALSQSGRPFTHGFEIYLERATLAFEAATLGDQFHLAMPVSVITADGAVERPELGSGDPIDAFSREISAAVASVASGSPAPELSGALARQALVLCHAEVESARTGRTVSLS
ncbi:Gfo/Idh/MocA family protein [Tautonia sociabilis]|uniref:Gfo/Idh/MocA family oxidoreductase n=1 Tax=Tautonia sociabilis TaxID=2080755 RepID=A0A432MS30_9BACT|nr:Gfo/Idh/MocA family oxidoreductase [Tautonia sociabilis]RUL89786.1 Gfo/Idh/MocA family oxidoreductase [Tautonia sociabilis]